MLTCRIRNLLLLVLDQISKKIKAKAGKKNVELLGYQPFSVLKEHMQNAKAFVFFAAEEDFGITPVEAQACGTPVIAYGKRWSPRNSCWIRGDQHAYRFAFL
ncbi:hypothetical protein GCM10020331_024520 [Ectobacillus funiculus]